MDIVTVLLLAVGLAMDAFAVSISTGAVAKDGHMTHGLRMATAFGGFQMLMPALGWAGGLALTRFIGGFDHWVAFGLLGYVGGKMIHESFKGQACEGGQPDPTRLRVLLLLAVATSIDALAVGLSFALLQASIVVPILAIGVTTFGLSLAGTFIGRRCGCVLGSRAELVGGFILLGIGTRILVQHIGPDIATWASVARAWSGG